MNCMNCKSVVDVGMEICPNCGFNLRVQRKCFSLSNMYYNLGLDKAEIRDLSGAIDMLRRSLKFNKYNIHARNLLGLVYFETGEAVAALSEWIISKNIMPENNVATEYIATLQAVPPGTALAALPPGAVTAPAGRRPFPPRRTKRLVPGHCPNGSG